MLFISQTKYAPEKLYTPTFFFINMFYIIYIYQVPNFK